MGKPFERQAFYLHAFYFLIRSSYPITSPWWLLIMIHVQPNFGVIIRNHYWQPSLAQACWWKANSTNFSISFMNPSTCNSCPFLNYFFTLSWSSEKILLFYSLKLSYSLHNWWDFLYLFYWEEKIWNLKKKGSEVPDRTFCKETCAISVESLSVGSMLMRDKYVWFALTLQKGCTLIELL